MTAHIIIVISCAAVSLIYTISKAGFFKKLFSSSLCGIFGLILMNISPFFSGIITANLFSACICAVFGIPGLISLLFMRMICSV